MNVVPTTTTPVSKPLDELAADVPSVEPLSAAPVSLAAGPESPVSVADGTTWFPVAFEVGITPLLDVATRGVGGGVGMLAVSL